MKVLIMLLVLFQLSLSKPYFTNSSLYANKQQIEDEVNTILKFNDWASEKSCEDDTSITYLRLKKPTTKLKVLVVCGIHARELITVDVCLHFLKRFTEIDRLASNYQMDMILVANPERFSVLEGGFCIRKDSAGVDLNRNYDVNFDKAPSDPEVEPYRGPYPMSEPLSQCVHDLLQTQNYTMVIDLHTGEFSLYFEANPGTSNYKNSRELLNQVKRKFCKPCRVTTLKEANDTSAGHLYAYASQKFNVEYSLLFQIFGGYISSRYVTKLKKCFKIFNPNTAETKNFYVQRWVKTMEFVFAEVLKKKKL